MNNNQMGIHRKLNDTKKERFFLILYKFFHLRGEKKYALNISYHEYYFIDIEIIFLT